MCRFHRNLFRGIAFIAPIRLGRYRRVDGILFPSLGFPRTVIYIFQFPLLDAPISIAVPCLHALGVLAIPVAAEFSVLHHGVDATTANRHIRTLQHRS